MAAQVMVPQKEDKLGKLLQVGGAIGGGILGAAGGPAGIVAGASAGAQLGGLAGGALEKKQSTGVESAMSRRMGAGLPQTAPQVDPLETLQQANMALASQPPEVRSQFEAPIKAALLQARRQQGVA